MRASTKAGTGVLAALAAAAVMAPTAPTAPPACVHYDEPVLYSDATVCPDLGRDGTTVAPSVGISCGALHRRICEPLFTPIGYGKTGVDDEGQIWINDTRFVGP